PLGHGSRRRPGRTRARAGGVHLQPLRFARLRELCHEDALGDARTVRRAPRGPCQPGTLHARRRLMSSANSPNGFATDHNGPADALVLFGMTGDLAHKKIFPALYVMAQRGVLSTPVVGVASSELTPAQLRARIRKSIKDAGKVEDADALRTLIDAVTYVSGDYSDPAVFGRLKEALGKAQRPVHYLAIPPSLFATVITGLAASGLSTGARVILEKPFGRDLA